MYVEDDISMMFKIYDEMNQTVSYKYDSEQKIIIKYSIINISERTNKFVLIIIMNSTTCKITVKVFLVFYWLIAAYF